MVVAAATAGSSFRTMGRGLVGDLRASNRSPPERAELNQPLRPNDIYVPVDVGYDDDDAILKT